ncbi:MAG: prepilin-type N-terminal cleavage/methylation domain-containing protein [Candidatus Melainabacteria bacterium]|jgi:prepilin-type N-terminal cleavage/methylation domain-containing protein|nr:prepilin-type N-terminal cleavage/methylation domain-containing protein [Candidatus Melainabacteria bacterium]
MKRNSQGVTLIELLISLVVITISLIPVINYFNATLRQNNEAREMTKIRFLVEEEMEKSVSLNYKHPSLEALGSNKGVSRFNEHGKYLIKTTVLFLDPETGLLPEDYPLRIKDDTNLKQITISAARIDKLGGQVNMVYIKSP